MPHFCQLSFSVLKGYAGNRASMLPYPSKYVLIAYDYIVAVELFSLKVYVIER
jgi:hypothetical protein